jgi:hypothetical protein
MGGTDGWWKQLATLDKATNNGMLITRYADSGPFQPHTQYQYEVCEGGSPDWQNPNNCAGTQTTTSGAAPVLTAKRVNATTVKLQISLDQYLVTSIVITRQGSDDPCRQGGTLGNGLQGCPTTNGLGGSPAQTVTVYNWNQSPQSGYPPGFQNSQSAPFVINLPDDTTVKPGVEYYYLAQVSWQGWTGQDSNTVTVPNAYGTATLQQSLAGGSKPIKLNGGAPPPPSQSKASAGPTTAPPPPQSVTTARPMMTPAPPLLQPGRTMMSSTGASTAPPATTASPANLDAAIKEAQQKPHDAQALYALGKAYCANNQRNTGLRYLNMALRLAEQAGNAPLTAQIKASLAQQGVSIK